MINLKSFALFESNGYNYTLDEVKALPIFSVLESVGFYDSTTDRIWNNGNMRLYNDELDMNDPDECITIYGNGPVRKTVRSWYVKGSSSPHILKRFPSIKTLEDWNLRFFYILEWARKRYKSRKGRAIDYATTGQDANFGNVIVDVYKSDPGSFIKVYNRLTEREREIFLGKINQTKEEFEKNISKYLEIKKRAFI
jgi:hypothetical protein